MSRVRANRKRTSGPRLTGRRAVAIAAVIVAASAGTAIAAAGTSFEGTFTPNVAAAQKLGVSYTGGTAGKANPKLKPFVLGIINQQGGVPSFAPALGAAKAAVSYINTYLGGAKGRTIKVKTCIVVSSAADAQACAEKMAADKSVNIVEIADVVVGTSSIYSTLQGRKPYWSITANTPPDIAQNTYYYFPGQGGTGLSMAYAKNVLHAKTVAIVAENDAGAIGAAQSVSTAAKALGLTPTVAVAQTASDFGRALISAGAQTAGAVLAAVSTLNCVPFANGVKQEGIKTPIIGLQFCADPSVASAYGGDLPLWHYYFSSDNPFDPSSSPYVRAFRTMMAKFQPSSAFSDAVPFGSTLVMDKMLNQIGPSNATSARIHSWQRAYKGPVFLGPSTSSCGKSKTTPSLCNIAGAVGQYLGHGKWKTRSVHLPL